MTFPLFHLALVAMTMGYPEGIEVRAHRVLPEAPALAKRSFCAAEREALVSYPRGEREGVVYHCWTYNEAFLNAVGVGVAALASRPLRGRCAAGTDEPVTTLRG